MCSLHTLQVTSKCNSFVRTRSQQCNGQRINTSFVDEQCAGLPTVCNFMDFLLITFSPFYYGGY